VRAACDARRSAGCEPVNKPGAGPDLRVASCCLSSTTVSIRGLRASRPGPRRRPARVAGRGGARAGRGHPGPDAGELAWLLRRLKTPHGRPRTTWPAAPLRARPRPRSCAASKRYIAREVFPHLAAPATPAHRTSRPCGKAEPVSAQHQRWPSGRVSDGRARTAASWLAPVGAIGALRVTRWRR
jgi:hypothetical protein